VTLNGVSIPISFWSATSVVATVPSGATSGLVVVSVAPSMNDSNPVMFEVTSQPLPIPWLDQDIGAVGQAGSATYSSGVFTVNGSGSGGVVGSSDEMHFVYQPLSGDGSIVARVVSTQGGYTPEAGVMIRETLLSGAIDAFTEYVSPYIYFYDRPSTGASSNNQGSVGSLTLPYWVEVVRTGNLFSTFTSPNGTNWTQLDSSQTITMAQNAYIGFYMSSDSNSYLDTATFDNVSVTIGTTPFVSGISPVLGGLGSSVTITGSNFGSTQGTSTVTFNGAVAGSITSWSNSQIVATVPTGATTGPVAVTVNSIESPANPTFTVITPVLSSVTPPAAEIGGQVTLTGTDFGSQGQVSFNGTSAYVYSWSDTSIVVTVPAGATTGPVTVTEDGVASNGVSFTVTGQLAITGVSPGAGAVGSSVTITGTGFGSSQSDSALTFNGTTATSITSWSNTQITAVVPAGTTTGPVTVDVAGITVDGPTFEVSSSVQLSDSLGNQSTYTSVMTGGKWYVSTAQGSGCSSCTVRGSIQYQYDGLGNLLSTTDELGYTTSYTYDSYNNRTSESQPAVSAGTPTTSYTYNSFGEVLTMTDPLGHVTTYTYDANGNLTSVTTPTPNGNTGGSVTQFAYNSLGELTQMTDPLGQTDHEHHRSAIERHELSVRLAREPHCCDRCARSSDEFYL
jgi:YD repeat-containing protein